MTTTKAFNKQQKAAAVNTLETFHECETWQSIARRQNLLFHSFVCVISSPWWDAIQQETRDEIIALHVRINETLEALDTVHSMMLDDDRG